MPSRPGEILGLIGPNGSGKSTVMKLVMGIETPNTGRVLLDGTEIAGWPTHRIARAGVGIVFQHSRPLNRQTVLENIKLALLPDSLLKLVAEPHVERRARARSPSGSDLARCSTAVRRPCRSPICAAWKWPRRWRATRSVVLIDEPFAGLTQAEVATFSELIDGFRRDGRAVLLVDHNVKSVARWSIACWRCTSASASPRAAPTHVMQRPNRAPGLSRRDHRDASAQGARCAAAASRCSTCAMWKCSTARRRRCRRCRSMCSAGEFVSIVGLNGAGKTTLVQRDLRTGAVTAAISAGTARRLRGRTPAAIARGGIVQCPETRELFGDMSVRENLDLGGQHLATSERDRQLAWLLDLFPILRERATPGGAHTLRRRAADAGDRARADDAAAAADPGRADPGPRAGDPGAVVEGARAAYAKRRRSPCCSASRT